MIITGSENGDSKVAPTIPSEGSVVDAQVSTGRGYDPSYLN